MPRPRQYHHFDWANRLALCRLDLCHRPVWILKMLKDQDGHAEIGKIIVDPPGAKRRVEPGAVPAPEGNVDIGPVISAEAPAQVAKLVGRLGGLDLPQARLFN